MANTNIEIKPLKDIKHFNQRKTENNRKKNIKKCGFDQCINIVEIVDPDIGLKKQISEKEQQLKRSDLTRLISSYNAKVAKCKNELNQLNIKYFECDSSGIEKDKIKNRINKKKDSLNNFNEKLKDFQFLKKQTPAKKPFHKLDNRNELYELRFSITKAPKALKRNVQYGKDLLQVVKDYIKDLGLDIDIHSYSVHMDQFSPHVHLLGSIGGKELTLNQQLEKIFERKFSLHSLQKDFNIFAKEHQLLEKYNLKLGDIVRGGMYEYEKNLFRYKEKTGVVEQQVQKQLENIKPKRKWGLVVETREQQLENILKPLLVEKHSHKRYSKNIEKDLIKSDKIVSGVLNEKRNNDNGFKETIMELSMEKKDLVQQLEKKDKEIDNIVKDKLLQYQDKINDTFGKQNKKIKEYELYIKQLEEKIHSNNIGNIGD